MKYFLFWYDKEEDNCFGLHDFTDKEDMLKFINEHPNYEFSAFRGNSLKLKAVEKVIKWEIE